MSVDAVSDPNCRSLPQRALQLPPPTFEYNMSADSNMEKGGFIEGGPGGALLSRAVTPGGHPLDTSQPAFPLYHRKLANPSPLGLSAFALTTFVLSLVNIGADGVTKPSIVISLALGYGGLAQLIAGIFEFFVGNTFGTTVFMSYGSFWISFGIILSPWSGIVAAYGTDIAQLEHAIGYFLFGWAIFTLIIIAAAVRSSIMLVSLICILEVAFWLLAIGKFVETNALTVAGGYLGVIVAFMAWYVAAAGLLTPETSYFTLPVGDLSKRD